ncbi:hypothetical protein Tco_0776175 [Tanacetum coccineum]
MFDLVRTFIEHSKIGSRTGSFNSGDGGNTLIRSHRAQSAGASTLGHLTPQHSSAACATTRLERPYHKGEYPTDEQLGWKDDYQSGSYEEATCRQQSYKHQGRGDEGNSAILFGHRTYYSGHIGIMMPPYDMSIGADRFRSRDLNLGHPEGEVDQNDLSIWEESGREWINDKKGIRGKKPHLRRLTESENLRHGAQGNCETEDFRVSHDDATVAQRRLKDKQLEERTNTDYLVKEQEKVHLGIKVGAYITVTGVPSQEGPEGNVTGRKKMRSKEAKLGNLLKYRARLTRRSPV